MSFEVKIEFALVMVKIIKHVMFFFRVFSASGDYYLQTNAEAPFARGEAGTSYTSDERIMSDVNSNFIDNEHLGDSLGNYNEKTYAESPSY